MTAFSIGRGTATDSGREGIASAPQPGPVAKALGVITELIPAESIAAYLAILAAVAALPVQPDQSDYRLQLNVWFAIPFGVVVSIAFAFIGAGKAIANTPADKRGAKIWKVVAYGLGLGILFVIYVIAMPGNPIEVLWHVPSAIGGLVAVVFTIVWGLIKALRAGFSS